MKLRCSMLLPVVHAATHGSDDHPLRIGDIEIPCYVLEDGRRVLSLGGMVRALGMSIGSAAGKQGDRLYQFATGKGISPYVSNELISRMESAIQFRAPSGGSAATGYEATILADLCEAVLAARQAGALRACEELALSVANKTIGHTMRGPTRIEYWGAALVVLLIVGLSIVTGLIIGSMLGEIASGHK